MTHVRTSPCCPQSNGKIERWHKSLKGECIRPGTPLSLDDARRLVEGYVEHYNNVRLNSAVGYITPKDMLAGRQQLLGRLRRDYRPHFGVGRFRGLLDTFWMRRHPCTNRECRVDSNQAKYRPGNAGTSRWRVRQLQSRAIVSRCQAGR